MNKVIDFEKSKPVLLTRIVDENSMLATFVDADGQKYIATPSLKGMSFIPLFEDCKQIIEYERKYGGIKRKYAVSKANAVGVVD